MEDELKTAPVETVDNPTSTTAESDYYAGYARGYREALLEIRDHQQALVKASRSSGDGYPNMFGAYIALMVGCFGVIRVFGRE